MPTSPSHRCREWEEGLIHCTSTTKLTPSWTRTTVTITNLKDKTMPESKLVVLVAFGYKSTP